MPHALVPLSAANDSDADSWLAAVVRNSDDAIISKTLAGIITSWNLAAELMFGYSAAEMIGRPISLLIPDNRLGEEIDILSKINRGERIDNYETTRRAKDGHALEVSVTISPVVDGSGRIAGISKIARNIHVQKQLERDLLAARERADSARADAELAREIAEKANRAKEHFLQVLSHELRTPLTPILHAVQLMADAPEMPADEVRALIATIGRNVDNEVRLIDDLLDVTRISQGKMQLAPEQIDSHAVIQDAVNILQNVIDSKQIDIALSFRAQDRFVSADPVRFRQIVLNLLSNAVKFTPAGGSVIVRTSNEPGLESWLKIEFSDTGIGIDSQTLLRLFQPFEQGEQTINRRFGGLGLGLSIVRALVELHGGSVVAKSRGLNEGSTFTVRLGIAPAVPVPAGTSDLLQVRTPRQLSPSSQSLRLLLVEDHADSRAIMARIFRQFGCEVTTAGSIHDALQLIETNQFDLMLSDLGLPDGSGLDLIRQVKARQNLRAIAISGFGQDDDKQRSLDAGFERHLVKPVALRTLQDLVLEAAR